MSGFTCSTISTFDITRLSCCVFFFKPNNFSVSDVPYCCELCHLLCLSTEWTVLEYSDNVFFNRIEFSSILFPDCKLVHAKPIRQAPLQICQSAKFRSPTPTVQCLSVPEPTTPPTLLLSWWILRQCSICEFWSSPDQNRCVTSAGPDTFVYTLWKLLISLQFAGCRPRRYALVKSYWLNNRQKSTNWSTWFKNTMTR